MYYHYDQQTKHFLFESLIKMEQFPATKIDIHFDLSKNRNQIFDGEKWLVVYDFTKENVYKKNSYIRIYKKIGEKLEDDEIIINGDVPEIIIEKTTDDIKKELEIKINGFLSLTDKYFNNHPPKYKGDINHLKKYREYLYQFTENDNWWQKKLIDFENFNERKIK